MPLDTRIALGVQPLQLADPLAREGQVQNILASQAQQRAAGMQQQSAQMQMDQAQRQLQQDEDYVRQMTDAIGKNGGPTDMEKAARLMATNRNPQVSQQGVTMLQSLQRLAEAKKEGIYGAPAPVIQNAGPTPGSMGSGTFGMDQNVPMFNQRNVPPLNLAAPAPAVNQLTPPPAAPVNQLAAAPQADAAKTLQTEYIKLSQFTDVPGVKERMDLIKEQLKELSTLRVVGRNLVTGAGKPIFTAPQDVTPSDTARLIAERDALPLNDPNRALYDRQIRDLGATAQNARDRLAFDQSKFNYEKANPGKTIKEITQADGSTQVVAIDNRTGMATQVMMAGAPGAAPAGGGRGAEGVTGDRVGPATPLVGAKPLNAQMNEGERKAATLLQRLQFSESQLTDALLDDPDAAKPGLFASAVAKLSTPLANTLTPETRQRVESAQLDILDAALTLGTGAAYTSEQLEGYRKSYFPQIGDSPKAILDKQARLNNVIAAAKIAAGRAEKLVPAPVSAAGASDVRNAADKIIAPKNKP